MYQSRVEFKADLPQFVQDKLKSRTELHRLLMRCFPSVAEGGAGRTMFRLPVQDGRGAWVMLVYSEKRPVWNNLTDIVWTADVVEGLAVLPIEGKQYQFVLTANPTARTRHGRIRGRTEPEDALGWVVTKLVEGGARPVQVAMDNLGRVTEGQRVWDAVEFSGVLRVQDEQRVQEMLEWGIGRAKAFGFGLLVLTPMED